MKKQDLKILGTIRREFSRNHEYPTPDGLRKLALSALKSGHAPGEIARAAGVSRQSIVNWSRQTGLALFEPGPVELKVVDEAPNDPVRCNSTSGSAAMARLTFRSGIVVELPVSSFDHEFLIALNRSIL